MAEKVLLVDDEEEFVETLAERMRTRGMEVTATTSGREALGQLEEGSYDVVILDLQMPGMDGLEALAKIKKKRPDIQVVLLTGHATVGKSVEAMKAGAMEIIEKPADLDSLAEIIHKAKATRMVLVDREIEDRIQEILHGKGW